MDCDGRCLPGKELCDFYVNCYNRNDEKYCETDRHGNRVYRPPVTSYPLR